MLFMNIYTLWGLRRNDNPPFHDGGYTKRYNATNKKVQIFKIWGVSYPSIKFMNLDAEWIAKKAKKLNFALDYTTNKNCFFLGKIKTQIFESMRRMLWICKRCTLEIYNKKNSSWYSKKRKKIPNTRFYVVGKEFHIHLLPIVNLYSLITLLNTWNRWRI